MPTALTDNEIDTICNKLEENKESSDSLKTISDMPSNNGVEEHTSNTSSVVTATESINPITNTIEKKILDDDDLDIDKIIKEAEDNLTDDDINVNITEEDLKKQLESEAVDYFKGLEFSNEDIAALLSIVKRVQDREKFSIYNELPDTIKKGLDKYFINAGMGGHSIMSNTFKNDMAEVIIDEFIRNISLERYNDDLNKQMDKIQNELDEKISISWKEYTENRNKYIEDVVKDSNDDKAKKVIGDILDAMQDGFALNRLKEVAPRIKIKKYDLENPKRVYDILHDKYSSMTSSNNIYSIYKAEDTLRKHMININKDVEDPDDITKFFIAICKLCMNYNPNSSKDHAFVYYALYNPLLLDIYKGDQYKEFYEGYKKNVLEVIDLLKKKK